eukprot:gene40824-50516_t
MPARTRGDNRSQITMSKEETHPAMLARTVATLDHILEGRL